MSRDGFMEVPIFQYLDEDVSVTMYVHTKEKDLMVFTDLKADPIFYQGWLYIEHEFVTKPMTSLVRSDEVAYLSYYSTPIEVKK